MVNDTRELKKGDGDMKSDIIVEIFCYGGKETDFTTCKVQRSSH